MWPAGRVLILRPMLPRSVDVRRLVIARGGTDGGWTGGRPTAGRERQRADGVTLTEHGGSFAELGGRKCAEIASARRRGAVIGNDLQPYPGNDDDGGVHAELAYAF